MADQHIAILVNPTSGRGGAVQAGRWLASQLISLNVSFELFHIPWPQSLKAFTEIWIIGGDGTFNFFINHYPHNELPLGLFKGGTGNDFAWSIYGNCTLAENFRKVWNGSPQRIDAASCNDRLFVNSSGIGFDGDVLKSIRQIRWLGGHAGYLAAVIRKIFFYKERLVQITLDGRKKEGKYLLMIINNSSRTGGGFLVTPKANLQDGKLDFVLCDPLSVLKRLQYLPVIEKGKHLSLPFIHYTQVTEVAIESEQALFAQLDGELISDKSFSFKVLPGRLLIKY